jgi:hypothetical protein
VLDPGAHNLTLEFDGRRIRAFGADGPYQITNFLMTGVSPGLRSSSLGATQAYLANDFEASDPRIVSLEPSIEEPGQSVRVKLQAADANFASSVTALSAGDGITVTNLMRVDENNLEAVFNIDSAAVTGRRDVTVSTGAEVLTLTEGFTVSAAPEPFAISPADGEHGEDVWVNVTVRDSSGADSIHRVELLINHNLSGTNGVFPVYFAQTGQYGMYGDTPIWPSGFTYLTPGGYVENSQAFLRDPGSPAVSSGQTLEVTFRLDLKESFSGVRDIWVRAADVDGNVSDWRHMGQWRVHADIPAVLSLTPASGSGASQAFTVRVSDGDGAANIHRVELLINSALSGTNGVYPVHFESSGQFGLYGDTPIWPSQFFYVPPGGSAENSQVTLSASGSSALKQGDDLTVVFQLDFKPAFAGAKNVWVQVFDDDGKSSGWRSVGQWTVP